MWEYIAEGTGLLATILSFFIFQQKKRSNILILKLICDALWIMHFLLLGAFSGMALSCVACLRGIVFFWIGASQKSKKPLPLLFLFLGLNTVGIGLMWSGPWSVCSLISGWLATVAYWQTNPNRFKLLSLLVCASQITYAIGLGSKASLLNELITLTSIGLFFLRAWNERRRIKKRKIKGENSYEMDRRIPDPGKSTVSGNGN